MTTLGFGEGPLAGVVRSDAGALVWRSGQTAAVVGAAVRTVGDSVGWEAAGPGGLALAFAPLGAPAVFADGTREWLCRARGVLAGGGGEVDCLGHAVVEPAAGAGQARGRRGRVGLGRAVSVWLADDLAITLRARRPARAKHHEAEEIEGFVLRGAPVAPSAIDDPRLSTGYAGDGRQRRAGLELWETEDTEYPSRLAGQAIGEGTLELADGCRLQSAFFEWRYDGRIGAGRYDMMLPA